ncbi:MAG: DUF3052 domain-containing protein [Gemmatimonadaceae bacterium]
MALSKATTTTGYSGTPLARKLGVKPGTRIVALNAPPGYAAWLGALPPSAAIGTRLGPATDIAHVFATKRTDLARDLKRCRATLGPDAATWVSWPKRASKVPTDVTEDVVREVALPMGLVDIKVCAVTDVWSGLKLVVRMELR